MKYVCKECGAGGDWEIADLGVAVIDPPVGAAYLLTVCPRCSALSHSLQVACDEPGCFQRATCGTPTDEGYRHTCGKHAPRGMK